MVSADVSARLLGMRLLRVRADVVVMPARFDGSGDAAPHRVASPRRRDGARGTLAAAVQAIESGADDLRQARERMP